MDKYQELFEYGPYVHYLVFDNDSLIGVFDNAKEMSNMIIDEPNASTIKIKELYTNTCWKNYKENLKKYQTINRNDLKNMTNLIKIYLNSSRCLGIYELLFLKLMINPELLVRNENFVRIIKTRFYEYNNMLKRNKLRKSSIMKQFELFLKYALRRYDSYCYRPYNLRNKSKSFV